MKFLFIKTTSPLLDKKDLLLNEIKRRISIFKKAEDVYLSIDEIKEISEMGFEIGSHGVSHTLLSRLDKKNQKEELSSSKKFLEHLISKENLQVLIFFYPLVLLKNESYLQDDNINSLLLQETQLK